MQYNLILLLQSLNSQTCWGRLEKKPIGFHFHKKSYIFTLARYAQHNPPFSWLGTGCAETDRQSMQYNLINNHIFLEV
jgi:hypothetical protein